MNIEKLLELKNSITDNIDSYESSHQFLEIPSKEICNKIDKKINLDATKTGISEVENVKKIYLGYEDMGLVDASAEGTWTLLTHTVFWEYMQKRWALKSQKESENSVRFIKDRYFKHTHFQSRNGIARLWWLGYFTYDETSTDHWHNLELLYNYSDKADLSRLIVESTDLANNKEVISILIETLHEMSDEKISAKIRRKFTREYIKHYNLKSAVRMLGMLNRTQIRDELKNLRAEFEKYYSFEE